MNSQKGNLRLFKKNKTTVNALFTILFFSLVTLSCVSKIKSTYLSTNVRLTQFYDNETDRVITSKIEKYKPSTNYWYEAERSTNGSYVFTPTGLTKIQQDELESTQGGGGDGGGGY